MSSICMTPITGPKAWRGDRLATDQSWIVTFTEAEIAEIDRALAAAKATGRPLALSAAEPGSATCSDPGRDPQRPRLRGGPWPARAALQR